MENTGKWMVNTGLDKELLKLQQTGRSEMKKQDGFQAGGKGVFKCSSCGQNTRETNETLGLEICPVCYEVGGLTNGLADANLNPEEFLASCNAINGFDPHIHLDNWALQLLADEGWEQDEIFGAFRDEQDDNGIPEWHMVMAHRAGMSISDYLTERDEVGRFWSKLTPKQQEALDWALGGMWDEWDELEEGDGQNVSMLQVVMHDTGMMEDLNYRLNKQWHEMAYGRGLPAVAIHSIEKCGRLTFQKVVDLRKVLGIPCQHKGMWSLLRVDGKNTCSICGEKFTDTETIKSTIEKLVELGNHVGNGELDEASKLARTLEQNNWIDKKMRADVERLYLDLQHVHSRIWDLVNKHEKALEGCDLVKIEES
jgi:hypothetical protein